MDPQKLLPGVFAFCELEFTTLFMSLSWNNTLNRPLFGVTHQAYFCLLQLQTPSTLP